MTRVQDTQEFKDASQLILDGTTGIGWAQANATIASAIATQNVADQLATLTELLSTVIRGNTLKVDDGR